MLLRESKWKRQATFSVIMKIVWCLIIPRTALRTTRLDHVELLRDYGKETGVLLNTVGEALKSCRGTQTETEKPISCCITPGWGCRRRSSSGEWDLRSFGRKEVGLTGQWEVEDERMWVTGDFWYFSWIKVVFSSSFKKFLLFSSHATWHRDSRSPARDRTCVPCSGDMES